MFQRLYTVVEATCGATYLADVDAAQRRRRGDSHLLQHEPRHPQHWGDLLVRHTAVEHVPEQQHSSTETVVV